MKPNFTIIVNCRNGEKYLRQCLDSIFEQTYPDFEVIFFDNLSSDSSIQIALEYDIERTRVLKSDRLMLLYDARREAIKHARGKYISFLDVDDWWEPEKLSTDLAILECDSEVAICCSNYYVIDEDIGKTFEAHTKSMQSGYIQEQIERDYHVGLGTMTIRKSHYDALGGFNPEYHIIGDFDLVNRASRHYKIVTSREKLSNIRVHNDNESKKRKDLHADELKLWLQRQGHLLKCKKTETTASKTIAALELENALSNMNLARVANLIIKQALMGHLVLIVRVLAPRKAFVFARQLLKQR